MANRIYLLKVLCRLILERRIRNDAETGDWVKFTYLSGVRNGYAEFTVGSGCNKRYGIIDRDGRIVAEPVFRGFPWRMGIAERYIQCCTTSSYNPQYRLFGTEKGTWVAIDPNRRPCPVEGHDGLFYTFTRQGRCGIRNSEGRQIIPEKYGRICRTGDNFIVENPQTGYCAIFTPVGEQIVRFRSVLNMYGLIMAVLLPNRTTNGITLTAAGNGFPRSFCPTVRNGRALRRSHRLRMRR